MGEYQSPVRALLEGFSETMYVKHFAQGLAHSEGFIGFHYQAQEYIIPALSG